MSEPTELRVLELSDSEFVVQFSGGLGGWTTFSDVFNTREEADKFLQDQQDQANDEL
jgi:hypothetical protein